MKYLATLSRLVTFLCAIVSASSALALDVVVTTDCGTEVDDQWAIAHLALSTKIRLLGVVANFAPNQSGGSQATASCSQNILTLVSRLDVPVFSGSSERLSLSSTPIENDGVSFLLKLSKNYSEVNRLQVLALGPVTDIAKALLLDPSISNRIEVNALAFDRYPEGGDGWNVSNDIRSWQLILDSNIPVLVTSGLIAGGVLKVKVSEIENLFPFQSRIRDYLVGLFKGWLNLNGASFPETLGGTEWPIWDEAVVAASLGFSGLQKVPRPALREDLKFTFPNNRSAAPFRWVKTIDRTMLFRDLNKALGQR